MKTKLTALALLAAAAVAAVPSPARADHDGLAVVGGILGGLLVASAIHDSHSVSYTTYNPGYVACPPPAYVAYGGNDGCWQDVAVQVWVPGCWIQERGYRGQVVRRYVAPHYESRNNRVWVASNRGYRNDRNDHNNRNDRNDRNDRNGRNDNRGHDSRGSNHR